MVPTWNAMKVSCLPPTETRPAVLVVARGAAVIGADDDHRLVSRPTAMSASSWEVDLPAGVAGSSSRDRPKMFWPSCMNTTG